MIQMTRSLILSSVVAISLLGLSYLASIFYADGAFERWHSLGAPPYGIGEITSIYFDAHSEATIVLTSADNERLQQGAVSACGAAGCWHQVDTIPVGNDWSELAIAERCQSEYARQAAPPGALLWCASYWDVAFGTHFIREAHFALLEDGSVWVWQFIPAMGALLIILIGGFLAVLAGLVAYFVLRRSANTAPR
jgi:hypothetical protein